MLYGKILILGNSTKKVELCLQTTLSTINVVRLVTHSMDSDMARALLISKKKYIVSG
jgi:hypothetical protein